MSACEEYIVKMMRSLPERCSVKDLIRAGIYGSPVSAYHARKCGKGPEYFQFEHTIVYPKQAVIDYLKKSMHKTKEKP